LEPRFLSRVSPLFPFPTRQEVNGRRSLYLLSPIFFDQGAFHFFFPLHGVLFPPTPNLEEECGAPRRRWRPVFSGFFLPLLLFCLHCPLLLPVTSKSLTCPLRHPPPLSPPREAISFSPQTALTRSQSASCTCPPTLCLIYLFFLPPWPVFLSGAPQL